MVCQTTRSKSERTLRARQAWPVRPESGLAVYPVLKSILQNVGDLMLETLMKEGISSVGRESADPRRVIFGDALLEINAISSPVCKSCAMNTVSFWRRFSKSCKWDFGIGGTEENRIEG